MRVYLPVAFPCLQELVSARRLFRACKPNPKRQFTLSQRTR
jgi:hypothetical protein